jgi:putative endonuclease
MYYVYFLRSKKKQDQYYVGYSANLKERFKNHNAGLSPATKPYVPWEIVFYEAYKTSSDAKRREMYLKTTKGRRALRLMLRDTLV